jgi:hypothetical protein
MRQFKHFFNHEILISSMSHCKFGLTCFYISQQLGWVTDCCLAAIQQFFSISWREQANFNEMKALIKEKEQRLVGSESE